MPDRTLVLDTATAACSIALFDDGILVAETHDVVGRGHAERLVPMIGDLPDRGRADRILVDVGPGSFTGLRVGIAAAIGLGIGWKAPVAGISSLDLIAVAAFAADPALDALAVVMEGGHGEVFMARYAARPFAAIAPPGSFAPAAALAAIGDLPMFGNAARYLGEGVAITAALPRAADAFLLPGHLRARSPRPLYLRAPDARPQASASPR